MRVNGSTARRAWVLAAGLALGLALGLAHDAAAADFDGSFDEGGGAADETPRPARGGVTGGSFDEGSFGEDQGGAEDGGTTPSGDGGSFDEGGSFDDGSFGEDQGGATDGATTPSGDGGSFDEGGSFDDGSFDDTGGGDTGPGGAVVGDDDTGGTGGGQTDEAAVIGGDDFDDGGGSFEPDTPPGGQGTTPPDGGGIQPPEGGVSPPNDIGVTPPMGGDDIASQIAAFETRDFGVPPTDRLRQGNFHAPTPTSVPGAKLITTAGLVQAYNQGISFIAIDVLGGQYTIGGSQIAPAMASPGNYGDAIQQQTGVWLNQITGGNRAFPLVIFCSDPHCWLSYNASLRAVAAGYTEVYWYRGGIQAWQMTGLPMAVPGF